MAKTYINGTSAKEITGQYGSFFNISMKLEDLKEYANEKGYVNLVMSKRKEPGKYGETHYFTLNEWKPEEKPKSNAQEDISVGDIPF